MIKKKNPIVWSFFHDPIVIKSQATGGFVWDSYVNFWIFQDLGAPASVSDIYFQKWLTD